MNTITSQGKYHIIQMLNQCKEKRSFALTKIIC